MSEHDHSHDPIESPDVPFTDHQYRAAALRELLIEKGVFTAEDVRREIELMEQRGPAAGQRVVARAWTNPAFRSRLLEDAPSAVRELGIDVGPLDLVVVENTPKVHNVIVCTLCSCYPRVLLGLPPDWYKSPPYRSRTVREPRAVLAEFGTELPADVEIRVHDSTADLRYMVLPMRPNETENWSEERLTTLAKRDSMIGVALAG